MLLVKGAGDKHGRVFFSPCCCFCVLIGWQHSPFLPPLQSLFSSVCNSIHNTHTLRCGFKVLVCLANISAETICSAVTLIAKITARQQTLFGGSETKLQPTLSGVCSEEQMHR